MLYHLLYPLHTELSLLNVTQYITFRTAAASITAFLFPDRRSGGPHPMGELQIEARYAS